jgi:fermentation-respiration switch protein FrsA (DUF1100 family)
MWLWGLLLVIVVILALCWRLTGIILFPITHSPSQTFEDEVASGHLELEAYQRLPKEDIFIRSPFGYELYGLYIPNTGAEKTVIISHGITQNAFRSLRYMEPFYLRGFNVLLIEHRNHGRSGGTNTSYGYYEKYDLKVWVDWVCQHYGEGCVVGVHGESMGAAIAIQHAAIDSRISFIVADCSYARIADEFAYRLKVQYHLPRFPVIPVASFLCKLRAGFTFSSVAPLDVIPNIRQPIFFIHGEKDTYILPQDSRAMYADKPGVKQLWIAVGSEHAESQPDHPEEYDQRVGEFLARIGVL